MTFNPGLFTVAPCAVLLAAAFLPNMLLAQSSHNASANQGGHVPNVHRVAVIIDQLLDAPAHHGLTKLEEALRGKGITVSEGAGEISNSDFVILTGVVGAHGPASAAVVQMKTPAPDGCKNGIYSAIIPAPFITQQWDLMYYVEIVGSYGKWKDLSRPRSRDAIF